MIGMLRRQTPVLIALTAIILVLTGSVVRAATGSPAFGVVAPLIIPGLLTLCLIMMLGYGKAIAEILAGFLLSRARGKDQQKISLLVIILAWAIVIALAIVIFRADVIGLIAGSFQQITGLLLSTLRVPPQPIATVAPELRESNAPLYYYVVLVFGAILLVTFSLFAVAFHKAYAYSRGLPTAEESNLRQQILGAVQDTRTRIGAGRRYHEAVLMCYREMCRFLSDRGHIIEPTQTPREFAEVVSARLKLGTDAVNGLTFLFEEARYSSHEIGDEKRVLALNHLRSLEKDLMGVGAKH